MTKGKETISLKTIRLVIAIFIGLAVIFGGFYGTIGQIKKDTTEQIKDNDKEDAKTFYPKDDGIRLQTNVEHLTKTVDRIDDNVEEFEKKMENKFDKQTELLLSIYAKLKDKDST